MDIGAVDTWEVLSLSKPLGSWAWAFCEGHELDSATRSQGQAPGALSMAGRCGPGSCLCQQMRCLLRPGFPSIVLTPSAKLCYSPAGLWEMKVGWEGTPAWNSGEQEGRVCPPKARRVASVPWQSGCPELPETQSPYHVAKPQECDIHDRCPINVG